MTRNSHCSYCGERYAPELPWPRRCAGCGNISYLNPLPVSVVLLPVDDGLLCIRREIEPWRGMFALPGGYIGIGESWQEAGVRELREETGAEVDPAEIREFRVLSAADGAVLIFGLARPRSLAELPAFTATDETSEMVVLKRPEELAFPLHTQVVREYFEGRAGL